LQDEIERAVVFDPSAVTTYRVSFGTKVIFENRNTGKDETYTILGPWESDPAQGVISYMSPFGNAVLNAKEGDELSFEIHETQYSLKVKKIEVAKF
jgi:transcription elongation GreA/GreB family factor